MAVNRNILKGIVLAFHFFIFLHSIVFAHFVETSLIWDKDNPIGVSFQIDSTKGESFQVFLKDKANPILGKYKKGTKEIIFYPVVPFTFGLTYDIRLKGEVIHEFSVPFPKGLEKPRVINIYPTSNTVPANLLKVHIQFSQPMQEGKSKDFILVVNEKGENIPDVFLDLQPELWNADRTSLTMWLDPGRIKRDLQPNLKMGPPLEVGLCYKVVISKSWKDQHGVELVGQFSKEYNVIHDDRRKLSINDWGLTFPEVNSTEKLIIDFNGSIDYELASNAIYLIKGDQQIPGQIRLDKEESKWFFTPSTEWSPGKYEIILESRLEDLAGNNLNRLFDHELGINVDHRNEQKFHKIFFTLNEKSMQ